MVWQNTETHGGISLFFRKRCDENFVCVNIGCKCVSMKCSVYRVHVCLVVGVCVKCIFVSVCIECLNIFWSRVSKRVHVYIIIIFVNVCIEYVNMWW